MPSNYVEILVKARDEAKPDLAALQARLDELKATVAEARATVTDAGAAAVLDRLDARLAALDKKVSSPRITMTGAIRAEAEIHAVEAALDRLNDAQGKTAAGAAAGAGAFGLWGAAAAAARVRVSLFQGALNGLLPAWLLTAGGLHLVAEAVIETAGTLIPAAVAFAAFGAAAIPTAQDIYTRMQAIFTISTATGQAMAPLSGAFARVADAVKPQVYQLFGDALMIANKQTGEFSRLATSAGQVVDQLGSRLTLAMTQGKGFGQFLKGAASDLSGWGNLVGNIGGILGNFLKQVPGYAQVLLNFADGITHVAQTVTGSGIGQAIIGAGLKFHGAFLYVGLGATLAANAVRGGLTVIGSWAEKAGMAFLATDRLGAAGLRAGSAMLGFSGAAAGAAALPWGWIAIAAAAVGFLAFKLLTAKDATQQWLAGLQGMIGAASAASGLTSILGAQVQVAGKLTEAQAQLVNVQKQGAAAANTGGHAVGVATQSIQQARQAVSDLTSGQRQLNDETTLYLLRLGKLGAIFGSTTAATGLLTAAGIKMSEMLDKSKWPLILQQVTAVSLAYQAMGQRAGILGADLNALTIAGSDNVSAMTKLNQAWTSVIGIVSGGQSAFITFEQSLQQAATSAAAAGASMTGLSAPALALRGAWQQAYANGANLIGALRMMSSLSPGGFPSVTGAVKDVLVQLARLGGGSQATRAEMVALAQEVKPGITNFSQLTAWLGHTRDAGASLDKILTAAGLNLQNLAADAAKLADTVKSAVIQQFNAAKMAANGTDAAIAKLANDIGKGGVAASQVHGDMVGLYNDLVKDGLSAQAAAELVSTLSGQLFRVPKNVRTDIQVNGINAAMANVRNFLALLNQITNKTSYIQAVPVGGGKYITGATQTSAPQGGGGPQPALMLTVRHDGSSSELMKAFMKSLRFEVRVAGGTGPGSVQRALGRAA